DDQESVVIYQQSKNSVALLTMCSQSGQAQSKQAQNGQVQDEQAQNGQAQSEQAQVLFVVTAKIKLIRDKRIKAQNSELPQSRFVETPPQRPCKTTITTPQKPTLCDKVMQYLDNYFSIYVNKQCVIMKADNVDTLKEIRNAKMLFPEFDLKLNKVDGIGFKVSSNKEIIFIEVSGGPENAILKHVREDTEKLIKEETF
ncbi:17558_t:CDS:2, partial [Racocetra fulgida]